LVASVRTSVVPVSYRRRAEQRKDRVLTLGLDVTPGVQGLHGLDDLEVGDLGKVGVGRKVEVLSGDHDSLCRMEGRALVVVVKEEERGEEKKKRS